MGEEGFSLHQGNHKFHPIKVSLGKVGRAQTSIYLKIMSRDENSEGGIIEMKQIVQVKTWTRTMSS